MHAYHGEGSGDFPAPAHKRRAAGVGHFFVGRGKLTKYQAAKHFGRVRLVRGAQNLRRIFTKHEPAVRFGRVGLGRGALGRRRMLTNYQPAKQFGGVRLVRQAQHRAPTIAKC